MNIICNRCKQRKTCHLIKPADFNPQWLCALCESDFWDELNKTFINPEIMSEETLLNIEYCKIRKRKPKINKTSV